MDRDKREISLILPEDEYNYLLNIAKHSKHFRNRDEKEAVTVLIGVIVMHHKTIMEAIDILKSINDDSKSTYERQTVVLNTIKSFYEMI